MYKRILVPVDGSDSSNKALVAALQMARENGGRVRLVHAFETLAFLGAYEYSSEMLQVARQEARKILDDAMAIANASGVPADTRLLEEHGQRLGESVADEARTWPADLVVLGTHGRRGVRRVLLGSGAEQVIRMAPVPVLVVRMPDTSGLA